jgi:integrase
VPTYKDSERGTWYASFYHTDWKGVKHKKKKRGFKTQREAKEYEREFLSVEQKSCDMLFSSLVEEYFADMKTRLRETTIQGKQNIFNTKITPFFGRLAVNQITAATVRKWQNEMLKGDYAPTYVKSIHNQLSAIFNYAVRYYGLGVNPCRITGSIGKKDAESMLIWTVDEFKKFIACEDKAAANLAFEVLFWTGIRSGELLALTPKDILPTKEINIDKTFTRYKGADVVTEPKTPKSKRVVPIPDFLYEHIHAYLNLLHKPGDDERIFYFTRSLLSAEIRRCSKLAGVKQIRTHDLRHSHASFLIEKGYDIFLISERLGHEKVETTMNTYGHLYPGKQKKMVGELQKFREEEWD